MTSSPRTFGEERVVVGSILQGRFLVTKELGTSGFGTIFKAKDSSGRQVAVKVAKNPNGNPANQMCSKSTLENEFLVLQKLQAFPGFPSVFPVATHGDDSYLIMELLERPLIKHKHKDNPRKFHIMREMLLVVDQLITRLEDLHGLGMVHGNLKPENLMMGAAGNSKGIVYLIDFGLATNLRENGVPNLNTGGSLRYMSTRTHQGHPKTPRDDLESLAYVLAFFLRYRNVTWRAERDANVVYRMKEAITGKELFAELPKEFANFYDKIRSLKPDETPKYKEYRTMFQKYGRNFNILYKFDWPFWNF